MAETNTVFKAFLFFKLVISDK